MRVVGCRKPLSGLVSLPWTAEVGRVPVRNCQSKLQPLCEQMEAWGLIFILIWINCAPSGALDQFVVTGPLDPIVAAVGKDVVLDCQLVTVGSSKVPDNMELHWINVALSYTSPVHTYKGGADDLSRQAQAYKGRTHLFSQQISQGNLSLKLTDVRVSDNGQYKCLVMSKPVQDEVKMTLKVVGRGNQPWIKMADYVSKGIRMACLSEGWFPRPDIQWINGNGNDVIERTNTTYQEDSQGLYAVQSSIDVSSEGSANVYFCRISTKGLGEAALQVRIQIADHFFPWTSRWLAAFLILLFLTLAAVGFALWYRHRLLGDIASLKKSAGVVENNLLREEIDRLERSAKEEAKRVCDEREKEEQERRLELLNLRQEFEKEKTAIQAEHERRVKSVADEMKKAVAKYMKLEIEFEHWRPLVKSEWDRIRSHAVAVHLDPQTASGSLEVSPMRVAGRKGQPLTVPDVPERFDSVPYVLGLEGFATGAHFWKVDVSSKVYWDIGVASDSVERKGMPNLSSGAGFWTFGRDGEQYTVSDLSHSAVTVTTRPVRIGVFLDLEAGRVSFYNADTMFHFYTFNASFSGKVYPFFAPGWSATPLIICPIES